MDLRHFRYFVAAVEEGSMHGAAQRLNVAQPALSRRLRDLELSLGCDLLVRSTRGVVPTQAGSHLYGEALVMLEGLDRATQQVRRLGLAQTRAARLGLVQTSSKYAFAREAIAAYATGRSPGAIAFSRTSSVNLAAALREGRIDLALLYERHLSSKGFRERLVHKERYVLAAHPDHRLAGAEPLDLAALSGESLVWLSRRDNPDNHDSLMQQCRLHGLEPLIGHSATSHEEQIEVTIASAGLCLTPASTMLSLSLGALNFRPLANFEMELNLILAWSPDVDASPAGQLLAAFHSAIDRHQAAVNAAAAPWAKLAGHPVVLVPGAGRDGMEVAP